MAGIYIHIPFCKQACHYCDFHFSTSLKYKDDLLKSLLKELKLQKDYLGHETIDTIYFGGGTPSLLNQSELNLLISTIAGLHDVSSEAEITLEANPDDLDKEKIRSLRETSVNRLSVGIQSFFDEDLRWMNRMHTAEQAEISVKRVQDMGLENISVDLIYGYPLLHDEKWQFNLNKVFESEVPHVSAYSMTVEPQTALASFIRKKKQPAMNEQKSAEQFIFLMEATRLKGFEHYEISNFCMPGRYSEHNSNYWKGVKYLGIGPSAHSYNGISRQWNISNNIRYIEELTANGIPAETEVLTETDRLNEYIMTSLRTMWGLDLHKLNELASSSSVEVRLKANRFFEKEWLQQKDDIIYLTPEGKLYADHISSTLFF